MEATTKENIKYKLLTFDELVINLDRLSRFKLPEESYNRVFTSIIFKCLIYPKFSKKDIEKISAKEIVFYVEKIWNSSVNALYKNYTNNTQVNNAMRMLSELTFIINDKETETLLNAKLNISPILNDIDYEKAPLNLKYLIIINEIFNDKKQINNKNLEDIRKKYKIKFPITKLIIVEGITEETLIPVFASKLGFDFEKEGIFILGAGGKSKSPDLYLKLKDKLKIPVILLFDNDAKEICDILQKSLLKKDKLVLIEKGEFEDILSLNLIKRSLNNEYDIKIPVIKDDLHIYNSMCENIEDIYRTRTLGEFKKAKFSKIIAKNIKYNTDITNEIKELVDTLCTC